MWKSTLTHLTQPDREKITQFRDDGMTMTAIAKRFGVSIPTISRALDEKSDVGQNPPKRKPTKRGGFGVRIGANELLPHNLCLLTLE